MIAWFISSLFVFPLSMKCIHEAEINKKRNESFADLNQLNIDYITYNDMSDIVPYIQTLRLAQVITCFSYQRDISEDNIES